MEIIEKIKMCIQVVVADPHSHACLFHAHLRSALRLAALLLRGDVSARLFMNQRDSEWNQEAT